jgi:hypothetical protein
MRKRFVLVLGVLVGIAGCGAQPQPSAGHRSPYPSNSPAPSPTSPAAIPVSPSTRPSSPSATRRPSLPPVPTVTRPTAPPDNPTDQIKKTRLVVGIVTRGGSGPCFGVQTDDGTEYALYADMRLTLSRGQYVRLATKPSRLRINCGPGQFREITAVQPTG